MRLLQASFLMVSAFCDKLLRPLQFLYKRDQDLAFGSYILGGCLIPKTVLLWCYDCYSMCSLMMELGTKWERRKSIYCLKIILFFYIHISCLLVFTQHFIDVLQFYTFYNKITPLLNISTAFLLKINKDEAQPSYFCSPNVYLHLFSPQKSF